MYLGYRGLSSLVLVALGAGTQAFTQRRGTGQAEQHSRTAASRPCRSSHLDGFSAPEVECLGLRDGTAAWQLCPLLALCAVAAEHVFGEPGASLRLWELDFAVVGDSELRLRGGHCTEWWVLAQ